MKLIDDMSLAVIISIKICLVTNTDINQVKPLAYHDRTGHILPGDRFDMQLQIDKILMYCNENDMKVNIDKTKVVLFNTAKIYDFMPKLHMKDQLLEMVEEVKLLGVSVRSDLSWQILIIFARKVI